MLLGLCPPPHNASRAAFEGGDDPRRSLVLEAYGGTLEAERKHEDAGVAYLAAGRLEKALQAYRSAGQWRVAMMLTRRLKYSEADIQRLAVQISEELAVSGQPAEGAQVLLEYLQDVDNAVSLMTQAKYVQQHALCSKQPL